MNVIKKRLKDLSEYEYYDKHLNIINQFFPVQMTKTEIKILAGFMTLKGDNVKINRFSTDARRMIKERFRMSDGGLGNHIKALKDKKFIYVDENNVYKINPYLIPAENVQGYQFVIEKDNIEKILITPNVIGE